MSDYNSLKQENASNRELYEAASREKEDASQSTQSVLKEYFYVFNFWFSTKLKSSGIKTRLSIWNKKFKDCVNKSKKLPQKRRGTKEKEWRCPTCLKRR